jgi:hypothetical protein
MLKNHAHLASGGIQLSRGKFSQILILPDDGSLISFFQPVQHAQQSTLAGAGWSDHSQNLSPVKLEVNTRQSPYFSLFTGKCLRDIFKFRDLFSLHIFILFDNKKAAFPGGQITVP